MFTKSDISRNELQLVRGQGKCGYDWWWHSLTARNAKTGKEKPFYIEFFACNPKLAQDKPVFGKTDKSAKPSYVMVNVGTWGKDKKKQLHRFYAWKDVAIAKKAPITIDAGECFMSETQTRGKIVVTDKDEEALGIGMSDAGTVEWNLRIEKKIPYNVGYGAGKLFRTMQLFEMFWHVEGMKTFYEGEIILDGERYIVEKEGSFGYADKNWGKNFTSPWVWLSSCDLTSKKTGKKLENSAFDIGGGRPKIGPVALNRKLLSAFLYEGRRFEFNFSKFWTFARTQFHAYEDEELIHWHVEQKTWNNKMVADFTCRKEDMLNIRYEAPTGERRHTRLWNGGNGKGVICLYRKGKLVDEILAEHLGCEYGEFDATEPYAK